MSTEPVTIAVPDDILRAAMALAEERGTTISAVASEALAAWVRGQLLDAWLAEHQAEHGAFDEDELRALAAEVGIPYLPPTRVADPAA